MIRKYATSLIIWLSLIVGELHTIWERSTAQANWIWTEKVVMSVQWNVKYAADELWFILMALSIYTYVPNRINKTTVKAYIIFCILDMLMYFYNYKQSGYEGMYLWLLISWILIYNYGSSRPANGQRAIA